MKVTKIKLDFVLGTAKISADGAKFCCQDPRHTSSKPPPGHMQLLLSAELTQSTVAIISLKSLKSSEQELGQA